MSHAEAQRSQRKRGQGRQDETKRGKPHPHPVDPVRISSFCLRPLRSLRLRVSRLRLFVVRTTNIEFARALRGFSCRAFANNQFSRKAIRNPGNQEMPDVSWTPPFLRSLDCIWFRLRRAGFHPWRIDQVFLSRILSTHRRRETPPTTANSAQLEKLNGPVVPCG